MHSTLTEHARCLYGDEYRPTPTTAPLPCAEPDHDEGYFIEELTFADSDAILAMLRELCPHLCDGYLPVRIRNLAYRLVLLQRPDEPDLLREAATSLLFHGPDWDHIAAELQRRADALEECADVPGPRAVAPDDHT
ncbi:hypothetical protein ACWCXH_09685 [Kitasatospora sp. NPDC001660]